MRINSKLRLLIVGGMLAAAYYLAACNRMSEKSESEYYADKTEDVSSVYEESPGDYSGGEAAKSRMEDNSRTAEGNVNQQGPQVSREEIPAKIIKSADIGFQVEKYNDSRKKILAIAKQFNARVTSENQSNSGANVQNTMVLRVDGAAFDSLVDALLEEAIYVDHKTINAQDVTEEYVDLQARLKSKKDLEAQYVEILKKAISINEILQVQQYLGAIREEIESFEGRLKFMEDRVAYSTIVLNFYEHLDVVDRQPDRSFSSKLGDAFGWGWNGLVGFFIGLIYTWPIWVILGFGAWLTVFLVKRSRRRRANKKAQITGN